MGKWKYDGLARDGKNVAGELDAINEAEVRKVLRFKGVKVVKIEAPTMMNKDIGELLIDYGLAKSFDQSDLSMFTKQMSVMISSGIPILQALEVIYKQQSRPGLKKVVKQIAADVGGGKTLFDSISKHKGFGRLYCYLIKAGESAGILDQIFIKIADFLDRNEKIKSQIKGALTYPSIVVIVGIGVIYGMITFVVPQFQTMLEGSGKELPAVTQFLLDLSAICKSYGLIFAIGFVVFLACMSKLISSPIAKPIFDKIILKFPLIGGIILKGNLASFTRTLATMISSGVPLIDSLDVCIETIDNSVIAKDLKLVKKMITEGKNFAEPLMQIPYFPPMVSQMVKIGEQTGNLDKMLGKVAVVFEDEVSDLISQMTKLFEPLILVVLGGAVAFILIAMYLPIFSSMEGM